LGPTNEAGVSDTLVDREKTIAFFPSETFAETPLDRLPLTSFARGGRAPLLLVPQRRCGSVARCFLRELLPQQGREKVCPAGFQRKSRWEKVL